MKVSISVLLILFLLTSCSSYINKVHSEIDAHENAKRQKAGKSDPFSKYRNFKNRRMLKSTSHLDTNLPRTRRQYRSIGKRRFKAQDLVDNSNNSSLWVGSGNENYLFENKINRKPGDIIIIKVQNKLKRDITNELKKVFPKKRRKLAQKTDPNSSQALSKTDNTNQNNEDNAKTIVSGTDANGDKEKGQFHDKFSTQIIETLRSKYYLLRGQKEIFFRKKKRKVEIQALAPKKFIDNNDSIESDKILETKFFIVR